ncbi:RidA family protein [Desulfobulbus alkaliphilus]|uniref:RidA family protein n=1 Tax=Desulfobulbus alkaliphilus TaxID=869814 RepID=UPI001966B4BA|nr:RidA family protein [Desulfobulbus alkaliphilus]MBM9535950.1 RidA family protein [Desulfobulbus alkaliphilus]
MRGRAIQTNKAPGAIGPYSQAIAIDALLFTSGTLPVDPATGTIPTGDIEDHAHLVFRNLAALAEAAGTSLDAAIKVTIFLTNLVDFPRINTVYSQYFSTPYPARSTVQVVALPLNATIEVEAILAL